MSKDTFNNKYNEDFLFDIPRYTFLGKGHNGSVYLMPEGKVVKICTNLKSCEKEFNIFNKVKGSTYFPRAYYLNGNVMIRDYVGGQCLKSFIKVNGLEENVAINLIKLLEEFERLKFTKKDIRCKDIFIQKDGRLMIIDPKGSYDRIVNYPRHLCKGLKKLSVLEYFLEIVEERRPYLYNKWYPKLKTYFEKNIK